jgi:hypothetical protein
MVFAQKVTAIGNLSGRDDEPVPPGETALMLEMPGALDDTSVHSGGLAGEKGANIATGGLKVKAGVELAGNGHIEFLEHPEAYPTSPSVPGMSHPGHGLLLLARLGGVPAMDEDVSTTKTLAGRKLLARGMRDCPLATMPLREYVRERTYESKGIVASPIAQRRCGP